MSDIFMATACLMAVFTEVIVVTVVLVTWLNSIKVKSRKEAEENAKLREMINALQEDLNYLKSPTSYSEGELNDVDKQQQHDFEKLMKSYDKELMDIEAISKGMLDLATGSIGKPSE